MRISIFGLGYVGTVSAACFASNSHTVIGVDPIPAKVDLINSGRSPIIEAEISEMVASTVGAGQLVATTDHNEAILRTDVSFVCVGTPSQRNGDLDLVYLKRVCGDIAQGLKEKGKYHLVTIRSTVLPGTMERLVIPTLESLSGMKAGRDFGLCHNPEFLREGTSVKDFYNPPKTVIGELESRSGDLLAELYVGLNAPLIRTNFKISEMVKYVDNCWHALKIGFANEIGNICDSLNVDPKAVMSIFCEDKKLNISSAYLKPGFAFGGSCLPKDLRALTYQAKLHDLDVPILTSILPSNEKQVGRGLQSIIETNTHRIACARLQFQRRN